jgi:hypothetical protein
MTDVTDMNVSNAFDRSINMSVNELMISHASLGLFGNESTAEQEMINNIETPQVQTQTYNQSVTIDKMKGPISVALRQLLTGVQVRSKPDAPKVVVSDKYLGYYKM